ncbi:uncharacterized protein LOC116033291 [Ipomoea triloba]|uniref:uncharacterized protein LOC116033291 n=1 Tax=Ipomoea triloba TaxID=35885 RepID=UPI00125E7C11|nr:uncharacterized protein LOC116033291 [Ipomoea triloba]
MKGLFLTICWSLWNARNQKVWNNIHVNHGSIIREASAFLEAWRQVHCKDSSYTSVRQKEKWKRPPETTLKLNMDSALAKETRTTRVGAIITDHNGQFVAAMVKTARSSTLYPKGLHMLSVF